MVRPKLRCDLPNWFDVVLLEVENPGGIVIAGVGVRGLAQFRSEAECTEGMFGAARIAKIQMFRALKQNDDVFFGVVAEVADFSDQVPGQARRLRSRERRRRRNLRPRKWCENGDQSKAKKDISQNKNAHATQ